MTVWITKYALTKGLMVLKVESTTSPNMVVHRDSKSSLPQYFHGNDFHTDERSAKEYATQMVNKKIHSLEKQIIKLKKLKF